MVSDLTRLGAMSTEVIEYAKFQNYNCFLDVRIVNVIVFHAILGR